MFKFKSLKKNRRFNLQTETTTDPQGNRIYRIFIFSGNYCDIIFRSPTQVHFSNESSGYHSGSRAGSRPRLSMNGIVARIR